jgi:hypothetical protein
VIDRYIAEVLPLKRSAQTRSDQARQLGELKKTLSDMLPDNITAQQCYRYRDLRRGRPSGVQRRCGAVLAADAARPPLRCGPPPRYAAASNLAADGQVVKLPTSWFVVAEMIL